MLDPANRTNRASHYLYLVGRLRDGATLAPASAEIETVLELAAVVACGRPTRPASTCRIRRTEE